MTIIGGLGIGGLGWVPGPVKPGRDRAAASGFRLPSGEAAAAARTQAAAAPSLAGLLELQAEAGEEVQDRAARRRGRDLLGALAGWQRALLADPPDPDSLRHLAALARNVPPAADPRLRAVVEDITLRARVELARQGLES